MSGQLEIIHGDDETVAQLRVACAEEGVTLIDRRTRWSRFKHKIWWIFWYALIVYFIVSDYCRFKWILGLATTNCGCSQ